MLASDIHKSKTKPRLKVVATKYSQSTPTTHLHQEDNPPCSPADSTSSFMSSVSGIAEKSASELGSLLKNAYKSLREKEKNLLLAAEIGKSLLEHNQNLKADYDKLLQNVKSCEFESSSYNDAVEYENNMRLISSKKAYDTIIESLESKNADLERMLEHTQQHSETANQINLQKQRKLQSEIEILKNSLDIAGQKVQELEENKRVQQERVRQLDQRKDYEQRQTEDLELLEELTFKMEEMFIENKHLQQSKKAVEQKLVISLRDLDALRQDFESFEMTNQGYQELQEAFERQTTHIKELNDTLEDHRVILSRLRDKGMWSPHYSNTPSLSGHQSVFSTCVSKQSLMGELEDAWSKHQLPKSRSDSSLSTFSNKLYDLASITERNLTSFYNAPADYAMGTLLSTIGIDDQSMLNEAEKFLKSTSSEFSHDDLFGPEGNGSTYKQVDLYPKYLHHSQLSAKKPKPPIEQPKGLLNHILFQIRYLFRSVLRWCRFAIILTTAIFINLWKGPDLLLDKQHC